MLNKTIVIYAIIDDLLKAMPAAGYAYAHKEDCRTEMTDAEIITTAFVAAMFFNGNQSRAPTHLLISDRAVLRKRSTQRLITRYLGYYDRMALR